MRNTNLIRAVLLPSLILIAFNATSATADRQPIAEALSWVRSSPHQAAQYDYIMTARVRLLFFWAGKDDVGGGYIRRAVSDSDPHQEFFQVLFGSDPEKLPAPSIAGAPERKLLGIKIPCCLPPRSRTTCWPAPSSVS